MVVVEWARARRGERRGPNQRERSTGAAPFGLIFGFEERRIHSIPFYYSPHRCKFNSKRQSSTLNSIQKDKKGPRFPRQITPTRKWTHSSCISSSRESLLHTPVHPRIPAALIAAVGRVPRRWCIFYSKSTGVSHNSHMWDSRYGPP